MSSSYTMMPSDLSSLEIISRAMVESQILRSIVMACCITFRNEGSSKTALVSSMNDEIGKVQQEPSALSWKQIK